MNFHSLLLPACLLMVGSLTAQTTSPLPKTLTAAGIDFVLVVKGSYTQGSPVREPGREPDESQRQVTLSKDFFLAVKPISRAQWQAFVQATNYRTEAEKGTSGGYGAQNGQLVQAKAYTWRNPGFAQTDEDPVVMITWDDAQAYCRWLSARIQRHCRLPTEAEWEYACRAGTTTERYAGPLDAVAWHRANSGGVTHPLGGHKPNPWGLHDLYGPVWQWCEDWYAPYSSGSVTDPVQTNPMLSDKPRRVLRGGSFLSDASHARSAERYRNDPKSRNADNGFRVIAAVVKQAAPAAQPAAPTQPAEASSDPALGFSLWSLGVSLLSCFAPLLAIFFLIKSLVQRFAGRSTGSAPFGPSSLRSNRLRARLDADGFWILGSPGDEGRTIAYHYIVNGTSHQGQVIFHPGPNGHFIFTGGRPQSVTLQTTDAAMDNLYPTLPSSNPDYDSHSSRSSFPRAY